MFRRTLGLRGRRSLRAGSSWRRGRVRSGGELVAQVVDWADSLDMAKDEVGGRDIVQHPSPDQVGTLGIVELAHSLLESA